MKRQRTIIFMCLITLLAGRVPAQEKNATYDSGIYLSGLYNTLGNHPQTGGSLLIGCETVLVPRANLALGIQVGMYHSYEVSRYWNGFKPTTFNASTHLSSIELYIGWLPLNTLHHRLGIGAGYSFAPLVNVPEQPNTLYNDHGAMAKVYYRYIFNNRCFIGADVQYKRYFVYEFTPELLSVGVSAGYIF